MSQKEQMKASLKGQIADLKRQIKEKDGQIIGIIDGLA